MIDTETIELDRSLSIENQLRAQLDAAIADNKELHAQLTGWKKIARKWERRAHINGKADR